jgi:hypothetical protein
MSVNIIEKIDNQLNEALKGGLWSWFDPMMQSIAKDMKAKLDVVLRPKLKLDYMEGANTTVYMIYKGVDRSDEPLEVTIMLIIQSLTPAHFDFVVKVNSPRRGSMDVIDMKNVYFGKFDTKGMATQVKKALGF